MNKITTAALTHSAVLSCRRVLYKIALKCDSHRVFYSQNRTMQSRTEMHCLKDDGTESTMHQRWHQTENAKSSRASRQKQQATYQFSAIAASTLIISTAIVATYYRIVWQLHRGDAFPYTELLLTLCLTAGGMVGMEMYARVIHKTLWHDNQWGWALHKSHHEQRVGAFEANDMYAVVNAIPAFALCSYGLLRPDVIGGMCFGAGLGIILFGVLYLFIHDGLVHKRFPVGPLADAPVFRRIAVAHQIHHSNKYDGVPFGLFLGPEELKCVPGGKEELDRLVSPDMKYKGVPVTQIAKKQGTFD